MALIHFVGLLTAKHKLLKFGYAGTGSGRVWGGWCPYPNPNPFCVYPPHTHLIPIFITHLGFKWGGFGVGWMGMGITPIPTKETKIKGHWMAKYKLYSPSLVPGFALFWGINLEIILRSWLDESYFVELPNMSTFAELNHFWIMLEAFCTKGSLWDLAHIWLYSAQFHVLLWFNYSYLI